MRASRFWQDNCVTDNGRAYFSGVKMGAVATEEYKKWFTQGICKHAGKVFRRPPTNKDNRVTDPNVEVWRRTHGIEWDNKYDVCVPNRDSNFKSASKYERLQPALDREAWDMSLNWTGRAFRYMNGAVVVDRDIAVAESAKDTSTAYPHILEHPKKGLYFKTAEFIRSDDKYWAALQTEDPVPAFWSLCDKHELRSIAKIRENKIRSFTASNVHHAIASARLCLDMNERFYRSALKTPSFVGATKFRGGWNKLIRKLKRFMRGFALDESDFDASLFIEALWGQCALRCEFLSAKARTPENVQALHNLYFDIINSIMVTPLGDVVVKNTGNPSGQGNTIVDNTMILFRLLAYAFIVSWKKKYGGDVQRLKELEDMLNGVKSYGDGAIEEEYFVLKERALCFDYFMDNVEMVLNGDDNDFTVNETIIDWFNARAVSDIWTGIGVTTKSDDWEPRPVENLDFLSHTTRYFKEWDMYLPVPERSRILDSLLLGSKSTDVRWSYLRACALRIESWADDSPGGLRETLQSYITYLEKHRHGELVGQVKVPCSSDVMEWKAIEAVYMTDKELTALYCGFESVASRVQADLSCLFGLDLFCDEEFERSLESLVIRDGASTST
jgi:hypothetical protein